MKKDHKAFNNLTKLPVFCPPDREKIISQTASIHNIRIYGLSPIQIKALIQFYRNQTDLDPLSLNMTYEQILAGKL